MNKTTEALKLAEEAQTPLKDLLRAVPKDESDLYEEDKFCHHNIPYGRLIHEALAEIERLEALAEPVKQEPVACNPSPTCARHIEGMPVGAPLYAAPVDAKAIRAEALEEAAKVCDEELEDDWGTAAKSAIANCAANIRARKF